MILKIKNLRLLTTLGDYAWEKEAKRIVVLNIELHIDDEKAAQTDQLSDAVDYVVIEACLSAHLDGAEYNLLEKLAADCAQLVLSLDHRIKKVILEADKEGALKQADSVSITVEVTR